MPVYPRWRGELFTYLQIFFVSCGLSPLARGTHERGTPGRLIVRFIPAGAGNSNTTGVINVRTSVYPRWRGELG
ncbi:hypothetical protein ECQG_02585 [Escherichia coli TA255]|nr:hypothetical protein ECQG_02585 [Escherichia coli TA255]